MVGSYGRFKKQLGMDVTDMSIDLTKLRVWRARDGNTAFIGASPETGRVLFQVILYCIDPDINSDVSKSLVVDRLVAAWNAYNEKEFCG